MTIKVDQHGLTVQASRPATTQTLTIGAASAQSAAFATLPVMGAYRSDGTPIGGSTDATANNTTHIRVVSNANCWIAFGPNPTAAVNTSPSIYIPAATPEYFWVLPGERVAVVQDSSAGFLNIAELDN